MKPQQAEENARRDPGTVGHAELGQHAERRDRGQRGAREEIGIDGRGRIAERTGEQVKDEEGS